MATGLYLRSNYNKTKMAEDVQNRERILGSSREERPNFRVRFSNQLEIGRSNLTKPKLPGFYEPIVTSKFYSARDSFNAPDEKQISLINDQISKLTLSGPKEKYQEPILESHRYGWFREKFIRVDPQTERVHFPRRNSQMVKIQNLLHNAAKADQLCHVAKSTK